jgi:hypothetical protein
LCQRRVNKEVKGVDMVGVIIKMVNENNDQEEIYILSEG